MKALLIIDMQQGSFTPATPRYDAGGVVDKMNQLSSVFREKGDVVIYIQHDGSANGDFIPGTQEWKLLDTLDAKADDIYITKTANDCFYASSLDERLLSHKVDELIIVGCATDFCVDATVKSAYAKDYNVTVIADAHTTANRENIGAEQLVAHYNWVWQNMLPIPGCSLRVLSCEQYLALD
jgi:nicotinamidase-related amidase